MIRMLFVVGSLGRGGAETFAMKLFRASSEEDGLSIDFLSSLPGVYDKEVRERGRSVFYTGTRSHSPKAVFQSIKSVVLYGRYDFVLKFADSSLSVLDLIAANRGGAKVTAVRSMNSKATGSPFLHAIHLLLRPLLRHSADIWIAPSREAGAFMFGKRNLSSNHFLFLPNALPLEEYSFSEKARKETRDKLRLEEGNLLVGFVGRLTEQKNPLFLVRAFSKLCEWRSDARLAVVGDGPMKEPAARLANELGLADRVLFLEPTHNVRAVYSAIDVLWLPSFFEGMPNVVIEAQACGLPCLVSENVTREVALTELVSHLPLEENRWANGTDVFEKGHRSERSSSACSVLERKGYAIGDSLNVLETAASDILERLG